MRTLPNLKLHQEKSVQVIQVLIAGAVVIDYAISDTISSTLGVWFYALPAGVIAIALAIPVARTTTPLAKRVLSIVHYGLSAVLLVLLTDIFGPYFQLLILLVFTSVVWFQLRGMVYGLLAGYMIIVLGILHQISAPTQWLMSRAGLYIAGLTVLGVIFERVTARYRGETRYAQKLHQDYYFERTRLMSLINSMADAVIAVTKTGEISLYNGALLDLLDTNESLQGKTLNGLVHLKDEQGYTVDVIEEATQKGAPITREDLHVITEDGSTMNLYVSVSPVSAAGSTREHTGYILVLRDITEQKTLDEQRDEFISVASHELRTPIAIAEANISTALMPKFIGSLSEEGQKLLNKAHDNVIFLSTLVNDLTMLAKAEQGQVGVQTEDISPAQFARKMVEEHSRQAKEKGLSLDVDVADEVPSTITASTDALREILQNFITNAVKYTDDGGVTLRVSVDENGEQVVFAVADTGIGISQTDQKHIFEKFYRSEDYRTRQSGGTGLGLYIIKRLAERLGGDIWFESKLNKGSVFYCALPIAPPDPEDGRVLGEQGQTDGSEP